MYPNVIEIGGFTITSFGVMMFLSFLAGAWVTGIQLKRRSLDPEAIWEILPWMAIGGIVGAKLYYLGLHWETLAADPLGELTNRGGLVWYGGFFGGVAAYIWQIRRRGLPLGTMFDAIAPALALSYAIGRIGCFLVGDDYGMPTESWAGIAFPQGAPPSTAGNLRALGADISASIPDWQVLAVHPTQLYEVGAALVMFWILWSVSKRALRTGQLFGLYLGLYGIERFLIEFVRVKGDRYVFGLSTSQVASVLMLGVALYLWQRRAEPATPARASTAATRGSAAAGGAGQ